MIGACHAGLFSQLGLEMRRAVYAACPAEETIYRGPSEEPGTLFLRRLLRPWVGLDDSSPISLDVAFDRIRADPPRRSSFGDGAPILPERSGSAAWPD